MHISSYSSVRLISELRVFKIDRMEEQQFEIMKKITNTITKIISMAPQLETLSIERLSHRKYRQYPSFTDLFALPYTPLHPLGDLALQHMNTLADQSVASFEIYAGTLVTVNFDGMSTKDQSWSRILERLRDLTFPRLRQFRLNHCSSPHGVGTEDIDATGYLLHKTDENPHLDS